MTHYFGGHTVSVGGIEMAVRRAAAAGMEALQIFTAPPRFYGDRAGIRPERVERFQKALAETEIRPEQVMAHAAYVVGVATPDPARWKRASAGLTKELERSTLLGIGAICFHPGSAGDSPREVFARRVAEAISIALETVDGKCAVLIENTAGAGSTTGRTAAEIGAMLEHVPRRLRPRTGYGLDTCHLFASGYDLTASQERLTAILDDFEESTGEPPRFFHLNDSEGELGGNRDRHALIGKGRIGIEPFRWLLEDPRSIGIPLILETPQAHPEPAPDDGGADPWDRQMIELLRSLV